MLNVGPTPNKTRRKRENFKGGDKGNKGTKKRQRSDEQSESEEEGEGEGDVIMAKPVVLPTEFQYVSREDGDILEVWDESTNSSGTRKVGGRWMRCRVDTLQGCSAYSVYIDVYVDVYV